MTLLTIPYRSRHLLISIVAGVIFMAGEPNTAFAWGASGGGGGGGGGGFKTDPCASLPGPRYALATLSDAIPISVEYKVADCPKRPKMKAMEPHYDTPDRPARIPGGISEIGGGIDQTGSPPPKQPYVPPYGPPTFVDPNGTPGPVLNPRVSEDAPTDSGYIPITRAVKFHIDGDAGTKKYILNLTYQKREIPKGNIPTKFTETVDMTPDSGGIAKYVKAKTTTTIYRNNKLHIVVHNVYGPSGSLTVNQSIDPPVIPPPR